MTAYPNWFEITARPYFERHLLPLAGKPNLRFLQIGVFTGDASVWLLENVLTGEGCQLVDVDTWEGSHEPEHDAFDWVDIRAVYDARVAEARESLRVRPLRMSSRHFFASLILEQPRLFDFIYIDGDHAAPTVLTDAILAFDHLKPEGLLAFDDYDWTPKSGRAIDAPKLAIDAFTACYRERFMVFESGAQLWGYKR